VIVKIPLVKNSLDQQLWQMLVAKRKVQLGAHRARRAAGRTTQSDARLGYYMIASITLDALSTAY